MKVEELESKRTIEEEELEELNKIAKRRNFSIDGYSMKGSKVKFIRQGNFTICSLWPNSPTVEEFSVEGVSKKHPEYDPKFNSEVGKKLSLIRAFVNYYNLNF